MISFNEANFERPWTNVPVREYKQDRVLRNHPYQGNMVLVTE